MTLVLDLRAEGQLGLSRAQNGGDLEIHGAQYPSGIATALAGKNVVIKRVRLVSADEGRAEDKCSADDAFTDSVGN